MAVWSAVLAVGAVLFVVWLFGGSPWLPAPQSSISMLSGEWSARGANASNTRALLGLAPAIAGNPAWEVDLREAVAGEGLISDDRLVVALTSGAVLALSTQDGHRLWDQSLGEVIAPLVTNGELIVAITANGDVHTVELESGRLRWRLALGAVGGAAPAITESLAYFSVLGRGVVAIDTRSGREVWVGDVPVSGRSSPLVIDGIVYVATLRGRLYLLDAMSGSVRTFRQFDGAVLDTPVLDGGAMYLLDSRALVHALNARPRMRTWRGEHSVRAWWSYLAFSQPVPLPPPPPATIPAHWSRQLAAAPRLGPVVDPDRVYVATARELVALARDSGETAWRFIDPAVVVTGLTVSESSVYVSTADGELIALGRERGEERWRTALSSRAPAMILADGHGLYAVTADGHITRFD